MSAKFQLFKAQYYFRGSVNSVIDSSLEIHCRLKSDVSFKLFDTIP